MTLQDILFYINHKFVVSREFQRFIQPYRADYERMKDAHSHKNYFRDDLGFKGALGRARLLGLHKSPKLDILDIGTGPGMFPAVCNWYGHQAIGGDVPSRHNDCPWFRPCVEMLGVEVRPLTIENPEGLPEGFGERWDLITAFLTNFDSGWNGSGRWTSADWITFIQTVMTQSLKSGGRLCILPVRPNTAPLAEAARSFDDVTHYSRWGMWIFSNSNTNI